MHSMEFTYAAMPQRICFGWGRLESLAEEVSALGGRALVITTAGQAGLGRRAADILGREAARLSPTAVMHTPIESIRAGIAEAAASEARTLVALGGGSATGLAKGIARETGLPIIAVPTTYSGSESTPVWGVTEAQVKRTGKDLKVLPRTVIYDPGLFTSLPAHISAASGMNAIAHAVEGLYSADANPLTSLKAEEGVHFLAGALPAIARDLGDRSARADALYGAWLCATVLAEVGMGLHHKLCHALGGTLGLLHAETHAVLLPHSLAYNRKAAPDADQRIARALGADMGAAGLHALLNALPIPHSLATLGMREADVQTVVDAATAHPYPNPAPLDPVQIARLLDNAREGRFPEDLGGSR